MVTPPADALVRAQAGESSAFPQLYQWLSPGVLGYFAGRGSDDPEALTQEVFLTVFSRLGSVSGGLPGLRTFVFSIAHARYVDEVRRRARTPVLVGYEVEGDTRSSESAESTVLTRLDTGGVAGMLAQLNVEQRNVILLRIVAELPIDEVAEILGRSAGSVKQLQRRGLLKLKDIVQLDESEPQ